MKAPKAAEGASTAARRQRGLHKGGEARTEAARDAQKRRGPAVRKRTPPPGSGSHRQARRRCHWSAGGSLDPLKETSGPRGVSRLR